MRQTAWLHSHPKDKNGKAADKSRLETMKSKDQTPLIPVNPAPYLTRWLFDVGPIVTGAMGEAPVGYPDLLAWQELSGVELMPWEAKLLRSLSVEYLVERQKAEELGRPAPYAGEVDDVKAGRARVSQQVKSAFANLKRKED